MRKLGTALVLTLAMAAVSATAADLNTVVNRIDGMKTTLQMSNSTLGKATDALFKMVATKEQIDKIDRDLAALDKIQDPKEKQARLVAVEREKADIVQQATAEKEAEKRQLSASQKEQLPKVLFNMLLTSLQDAKLASDAQALLPEAKDALKSSAEKKPSGGLMASLSIVKKGSEDAKRAQQAVNEDLPRIADEAPKHAKLAADLAIGTRRLMAANKVPEGAAPTITSKPTDI
jgi:hypothetical protein